MILTYNEEVNLGQALDSVTAWADETFVLDSMSTDATVEIARRHGCYVVVRKFDDYAKQRNYALESLPIRSEWVLFLDADEWVPAELKREISETIAASPVQNGFYLNRRLIWMGRWIRRGYYPTWILRLFRHGKGRCEDRVINEQLIVEGEIGRLRCDFIHEDRKGVTDWIAKHNGYATREARELMARSPEAGYREVEARLFGAQSIRKRWIRLNIWNRMPPLLRPLTYFIYRYVLTGGFLDGQAALVYHFLHALWYPLLIDVKYLEMKRQPEEPSGGA
ncbi:MAG: glycosyltransferase family 2 protein [Acidobacteriota bacterium]